MKSTAPAQFELTRLFHTIKITDFRILLACLSFGFIIRLVPELLAYSVPIGFDTIYYASVMKTGVVWAHWTSFFTTPWLLNALIVPLYNISQIDPFLLLKAIVPLLYGLNVAGIYWFARKTLKWNMRMSVLAGVFFALQLASLRISWDLLRNTLGLGILLFTFSQVKVIKSRTGFLLFASLSTLSVFAHEYAAVILLFVVFGLLARGFVRKQVNLESKRLTLGVLPALSVFAIGMYLRFNPIRYTVTSNVIGVGDTVSGKAGGVFFLVDYLHVQNSVDSYSSYFSLAGSVLVLFAFLFLPYLFLVAKGFFKNGILNFWTGLLLVGSFGCLIVPFSAIEYWHRWMFMLVYPFTFYAVLGLSRLWKMFPKTSLALPSWPFNKKTSAMVLLTFYFGLAYLTTPIMMPKTGVSVASLSQNYLYFSDSPTVPYEDVENVVQAMHWLNKNVDAASCVALQHAFLNWGTLYLDKAQTIVHFDNDVNLAVTTALEHDFTRVYFVWWNTPIGWYHVSVPQNLVSVQDFGRISIYVYGDVYVGGN
jgi:hypothetical protein